MTQYYPQPQDLCTEIKNRIKNNAVRFVCYNAQFRYINAMHTFFCLGQECGWWSVDGQMDRQTGCHGGWRDS